MTSPDTLLVIPTYRDSTGLAEYLPKLCAELARGPGGVLVQVVEDGSSRGEQMWLTNEIDRLRREYLFLQPLQIITTNQGKGHAIRAGWSTAQEVSWLAFVDADGAVPTPEVTSLLERARSSPGPAMFIAVRADQAGKSVSRFWYRRLGSRIFNGWVRLGLGLEFPDTQCGLKVIPAIFYREGVWRENGFAFDLELLLHARAIGLPVIAQPINWSDRAGTSLGFRAVLGLFAAVWRLRGRQSG